MFMETYDILKILEGCTVEYIVEILEEVANQYDLTLVDLD